MNGSGWRALEPENRCLVPLNSFAEYAPDARHHGMSEGPVDSLSRRQRRQMAHHGKGKSERCPASTADGVA